MTTKNKKDPAVVESARLALGDACGILNIDDTEYRLEPVQVHQLLRDAQFAASDLHVHSNA